MPWNLKLEARDFDGAVANHTRAFPTQVSVLRLHRLRLSPRLPRHMALLLLPSYTLSAAPTIAAVTSSTLLKNGL